MVINVNVIVQFNYREELTHLRQSTNYWECKHNITTTSQEYGVRLQSILMDLHPDDSLSVFDGGILLFLYVTVIKPIVQFTNIINFCS